MTAWMPLTVLSLVLIFGLFGLVSVANAVQLNTGDLLIADPSAPTQNGGVFHLSSTGSQISIYQGGNFVEPTGIAIDRNGDIIVGDPQAFSVGGAIFKVNPITGVVTTVSSGGNFVDPRGVTIDANGNIFVADSDAFGFFGGVIKVDPTTGIQTRIYTSSDVNAGPYYITIDRNGDLLITDVSGFNQAGGVIRINPVTGASATVSSGGNFVDPLGIAVDANGNIFVADNSGKVIRVDPTTGGQTVIASGSPLVCPTGLTINNAGNLLVDDPCQEPGATIEINPTTGTKTILALFGSSPHGIAIFNPTLPDGSKIVFYSTRNGNYEIYTMNADGTGQTNISNHPADDLSASWSSDGTKIVFETSRDGNREIYRMNADGTGQTNISNDPGFDGSPRLSPDGTKIVFFSLRDGNHEIYRMNADGTGQTRLTNNPTFDASPSWSPDGSKIVFQSNRNGNQEIYVMNADGTGQTNISNNPAADGWPNFSPDGTKIVFHSTRNGLEDVYVMNADGTAQTRLTNNPAADADASWSPDGTKIVFTSYRNGNAEIYVMKSDGTSQTNISYNPAYDDGAYWSDPSTADTTPPAAPVITTASGTTNDNTPTISGDAETSSTVEIFDGATSLGTTTANSPWSFTPATPLADGPHTITAKARDAAGNESGSSNTLTLTIDTQKPVVTVPTQPVLAIATSPVGVVVSFTVTATDPPNVTLTPTCTPLQSGDIFPVGDTLVTCNATDSAGNTDSGQFTVSVSLLPSNLPNSDVTTDQSGNTVITSSDPSSGTETQITLPPGTTVDPTASITTQTVGQNNSVEITGVTVPYPPGKSIQLSSNPGSTSVCIIDSPQSVSGSALPNCGNTDYSQSKVKLSCSPTGVTETHGPFPSDPVQRTYTCTKITNPSGDTFLKVDGLAFSFVMELDTTPPTITVPADVTAEATSQTGTIVTYVAPTATDIADPNPIVSCSPVSGSAFALGSTEVACTASDASGNTSSTVFVVNVVDTTSPLFTDLISNIEKEAQSPNGANVDFNLPIATDNIDGTITTSCNPVPGSLFALGDTTVTCSAADSSGNQVQEVFTVTVVDTTAPFITAPTDITAEATGTTTSVVTGDATATDAVGSVTITNDSPGLFLLGATTVTYTATDSSGNSASATQTVTVVDTTVPVLTVPSDISVDSTTSGTAVSYTASATDSAEGAVTATCSPSSGSTFTIGTTTVTCSASDSSGNTRSASFTVTVVLVNTNTPPNVSAATASIQSIWPPNNRMVPVNILGVTDADGDRVTIKVTRISQDEKTGSAADASGIGTSTAMLKAERNGNGDGRAYHIFFTADDGKGGITNGKVIVKVPHDQSGKRAVDQGALYDSTKPG